MFCIHIVNELIEILDFLLFHFYQIYLILNPSDYKNIRLPDVIRSTLRQTKPTLEVLGFKIGTLIYEDDLGKDEVLEMRYKGKKVNPGDLLKKTSVIDLVLGNGIRKIN